MTSTCRFAPNRCHDLLDIHMEVVCSRVRHRRTAAGQFLIATLGVDRWRQSRTGLARDLQKNPDMVSQLAGEGAKNRINDPAHAAEKDCLDQGFFAQATTMTAAERPGQTF